MRCKSPSKAMVVCAILAMALALASGAWAGAKKGVLYSFKGGNDGEYPTYSPLVFGKDGNLYGTTFGGGKYGLGTVFELKANKDGSWSEAVIHTFAGGRDGAEPFSGLVSDAAGNLYGATGLGGGLGKCFDGTSHHCGTVYRLSPRADRTWSETILRRFDDGSNGGYLYNALILDGSGNLYGVAEGGDGRDGVAFELMRGNTIPWREKVLYSFNGSDGNDPESPLMFDAKGNLYGTTIGGAIDNAGVVFKLTPMQRGPWKETMLHSFTPQSHDGAGPSGLLAFDEQGNLYGSTENGGRYSCQGLGCGVVYELTKGSWKEIILHYFYGNHFRGIADDTQGVAFDTSGRLYGTAAGTPLFPGGIFQLTHQRGGAWRERVIYKFPLDISPGMVTYGLDGRLYGASFSGGEYNLGQVYRTVP